MGVVLGGFQSPGGRIWGFLKRRGSLRGMSCRRGRTCRRGRDFLCGRDCRRYGIASVGCDIWTIIIVIIVLRESYVEGTTFSGGLPPYVLNRLVDPINV